MKESKYPDKGSYILIIHVDKPIKISIGKLGVFEFKPGYYAYVGSAMGKGATSLIGRVKRHLRKEKKLRWHVDYLLSKAKVVHVLYSTLERSECTLSKMLYKAGFKPYIKGFGSSDCRQKCVSHLYWLGEKINIERQELLLKLVSHL